MAEAVGATAFSYLGGWDAIHSLSVRFYFNESRAIVWADLTRNTLDGQLAAVSAFAEVRDCYAGELELELELRFGSDSADDAQAADSARIEVDRVSGTKLTASSRHVDFHNGHPSRGLGVNDVVRFHYSQIHPEYELLHVRSNEVRYGGGITAGSLADSKALADSVLAFLRDEELIGS
jgi:hypothetical protein